MPETVDILVPQIMSEQVAEVIQVIPQEPGSEPNCGADRRRASNHRTDDTGSATDSASPSSGTRGRRDPTGAGPSAHLGA